MVKTRNFMLYFTVLKRVFKNSMMVSIINNFYNHLHIQMKAQICKYKHSHSMSALWGTRLGVGDSTVNKTDKVPAVIELKKN